MRTYEMLLMRNIDPKAGRLFVRDSVRRLAMSVLTTSTKNISVVRNNVTSWIRTCVVFKDCIGVDVSPFARRPTNLNTFSHFPVPISERHQRRTDRVPHAYQSFQVLYRLSCP